MYKNIVLPIDNVEASKEAIENAEKLARKFNAGIYLINVLDVRDSFNGVDWKDVMEEEKEKRKEKLRDVEELLDGVEVSSEVRKGVPHKEITRYAEEKDADLIVMASRNRKGMERLLLGSTTEKVLRTADRPVMTTGIE